MSSQSRIRLFAGPNGSGKTSLYYKISQTYKSGIFINADEIEKELQTKGLIDLSEFGLKVNAADLKLFFSLNDSKSLVFKAKKENFTIDITVVENFIVNKPKETNSYEAAFAASFIRYLLFKEKKSFSYETVMSDGSKLRELETAKQIGFKTYLYFVCTDDYQKNIDRVQLRVSKGGHNVDVNKIEKRYFKTLENLTNAIKIADRAFLFDNSGKKMNLLAEVYQGQAFKFYTANIPLWFEEYVYNKFEF
jgi:predicted ABC-type ATPase